MASSIEVNVRGLSKDLVKTIDEFWSRSPLLAGRSSNHGVSYWYKMPKYLAFQNNGRNIILFNFAENAQWLS